MAQAKSTGIIILIAIVVLAGLGFYAYKKTERVNQLSAEVELLKEALDSEEIKSGEMKKFSEELAVKAANAEAQAMEYRAKLENCQQSK